MPQVGVFDTSFHQTMPDYAYMYALPYELYEKYGVRRYGFHGTSHRYITKRALEMMGVPAEGSKIITCHIGNGGSVAAVKDGKSIDTSMGMTPLAGLMMGTRSGAETGFAPDIGAIIAFIEASTERRPDLIVGKPYVGVVEAALERTGLKCEDLAMVGDRLYTDIETGIRHGMTSILVMTGETTEEMRLASETKPDLVYGRLSDMIPEL